MPWDFWLIFVVLGVILPWRGRGRVNKLLAMPHVGRKERLLLYTSTIAFQWAMVAVVGWRAWTHGFTAPELGLSHWGTIGTCIGAIVGAAVLGALQWLNLRRVGRTSSAAGDLLRKLAVRIFPQSRVEILPFFGLAVTAGLCEEFLYRGFVIAASVRAGLPVWSSVALSSVLFGLAHLYQGRGGFLGTTFLGGLFGVARIRFGSLVPIIVWHTAVDLVGGIAGPRYLRTTEKG